MATGAAEPLVSERRKRLAIVLGLCLGPVAFEGCTGRPRSDAWMRAHFSRHREEFDRLVRMSNEDFARTKVIRIADDFTRLADDWGWPRPQSEWGITPQRWEECREAFRRLKPPAAAASTHPAAGPRQIDDEDKACAAAPMEGSWYLYEWTT